MRATKRIMFRVTQDQFDRIRNKAVAKGYITISAFLRNMALENDLIMEDKINKIYKKTIEN